MEGGLACCSPWGRKESDATELNWPKWGLGIAMLWAPSSQSDFARCPPSCANECVCVLSRVRLFATPKTIAHLAPLSMGFSRQDYWSGVPLPSPGKQYIPSSKFIIGKLFSRSFVSDSLQPHGLQHTGLSLYLPELTQTHVHWVSDAIQPSCSLSSPSPPTFSLSQHQGLF